MSPLSKIFCCHKNPQTIEELPVICHGCAELCYLNSMKELLSNLKVDIAQYNNMNKTEEIVVEKLISDAVKKGEIFILNHLDVQTTSK